VVASAHGHPGIYDALVALHVIAAIVGFGAVALSGIYGGLAARQAEPDAAEESARYFRSPGRAEWLILAVPVLGSAALGFRREGAGFGDTWVVAALVIWAGAAGLLLGVVRPAERDLRRAATASTASSPSGREAGAGAGSSLPVARPARRLKWGAAACDVLFVAALVLMIAQPA
jgi:hypothetical protein